MVSDPESVALRCLIVDDNEAFLTSASRLLESQGVHVVGLASSSDEALLLVKALDPEVVLVDVQLGDEDGLELTRRLMAREASMRVVLISSHSEDVLGELIYDGPALGFLPKTALSADAIADLLG
jgi:two-component system, NarL family, nitrate/nitrite response regulator NarL